MLVFIDESGFPRASDPNLFCTLAAVALPAKKERDFCRELFNLKKRYWHVDNPHDFEIKGRLLLNVSGLRHPKKQNFVDEVMHLCKRYDIVVFATARERPLVEIMTGVDDQPLSLMYQFLLERINLYMLQNFPDRRGVLFFDSQNEKENRKTALRITNFLYRGWGKEFEHIVPTPFFADSVVTAGIQVADLVAYCVNQRFMRRPGIMPYYRLVQSMQFISHIVQDGKEVQVRGIRFVKPRQLTLQGEAVVDDEEENDADETEAEEQ